MGRLTTSSPCWLSHSEGRVRALQKLAGLTRPGLTHSPTTHSPLAVLSAPKLVLSTPTWALVVIAQSHTTSARWATAGRVGGVLIVLRERAQTCFVIGVSPNFCCFGSLRGDLHFFPTTARPTPTTTAWPPPTALPPSRGMPLLSRRLQTMSSGRRQQGT